MKMMSKSALALAAGLLCACDDAGPSPTSVRITFAAPVVGAQLTCADDEDRTTDDLLETTVRGLLINDGADISGLTAELVIDGDDANVLTQAVGADGAPVFERVPLTLGDHVLELRLIDGGVPISSAIRNITTSIDTSDPDCGGPPPAELAFVTPTADATLDEGDDTNLADDLQITVEVRASGDTPVSLTVNGEAAGETVPAGDVARFPGVTLPIGDGELTASTLVATQGDSTAEITVNVTIDGCQIELSPEPIDGCWGAEQDADPDTDGIQVEFSAQTNCGAVTFEQNGDAGDAIAVVDNVASTVITLAEGSNTVRALATTEGGLRGEATGDYLAGGAAPTVSLNVEQDAVFTLTDAVEAGWELTGGSEGLASGDEVTVTFEPATVEPITTTVDDDGNFVVAVSTAYACPVTVRGLGANACGVEGVSAAYTICFDGIAPVLSITDPANEAVLMDNNAEQDGVQTAFSVTIADARPDTVDYDIGIACAGPEGEFQDVSIARRPRSAAEDGVLVVPVNIVLDDGPVNCRAVAETVNNAAVTPVSEFVIGGAPAPGVSIISPDPANAPACSADAQITGAGAGLSAANAMLTAVIAGDADVEVALAETGEDQFGAAPELADGSYTVTIQGESDRGPVAVEPADPVPFIVDSTAPVVNIVSPAAGAELGAADDANNDLSDCVQTQLTVSLDDANTQEICWTLNDGVEACAMVGPNGQATSDEVTLADGENSLALRAVDCAGNETREVFNFTTVGCGEDPRDLAITSPGDGELIRAAQDLDAETDGCQFELNAGGNGFADGTEFVVCADSGDADPRCPGGGAVVSTAACVPAGGVDQNLTCQISAPDGEHQLTVVSTDDNPFSSAPITLTVDCTPPAVTALSVVEDDGSDCVDANEAGDADADGNYALTIRVAVDGIDDGDIVAVRALPADDLLNTAEVQGGVATVDVVLPEGEHVLYAAGTDSVGNPTAAADDAEQLSFTVDATAPTPELLGLVPDSCLNAGNDADAGTDDLQYAFSISTGGAAGETLNARLRVDGDELANLDDVDGALDFDAATLGEGDHRVIIAVTDACGNVGSVAGFDGDAPASFGVRVDTIAPMPTLGGVAEGQALTFDDDADAMTDGLQIELSVDFAADTGPEAGQDIEFLAGAGLLGSVAGDGSDGPLMATVTLPAGASALTATTQDSCGNVGTSPVVNVTVDAGACASMITGFAANPAVLGPGDGIVDGENLQVTLTAQVEAGCAGGTAELLVDGAVVANTNVGDGNLSFADVALAVGERAVSLRVQVGDETADSPVQTIVVDLTAPAVVIDAPTGAEPIAIVDDADPDTDGQQVLVAATITEDPAGSMRTARVEVNDVVAAGPVDVAAGSPVAVDFGAVTVPAGDGVLRICVLDMAGNEGCSEVAFNADPGAPGAIEPEVVITDRRRPRVVLEFTAPGEDGDAGGRVARYRVRRAAAPIVTENDWGAATPVVTVGATVDPGALQRIAIDRLLAINTTHHLAVRGVDDGGREGAFTSVPVDLSLSTATFDLDAPFAGDDFFNGGSLVAGAGDVDGDGMGDFLMYGNQIAGQAAAAVVFGGDGADAAQVTLTLDAGGTFQATDGGALGDINGDGRADVALLGYSAAFDATRVAIYLGGERADVAEPDTILTLPGRLTNFVTGVGNFNGAGFADILIGGSPGGGGNTAFVVDGRADWPAELDASDPANGVTIIELPDDNAGVFGAGIGDIDGDGNMDLALGAGGNFDMSYVFYGAEDLPDTYTFDVNNDRTVALVNPCVDPSTSFGSWFAGGVDLTGDGAPDFMVGARGHKAIAVFDQDLNAQRCVRRAEVQFGVNFDVAGDLNVDGAVDLIATHRDDQGRAPDALAFYNDGAGQFGDDAAPTTANIHFTEADVVRLGAAGLGDFNGDDLDDVVIIHKVPGGPLRATVHY